MNSGLLIFRAALGSALALCAGAHAASVAPVAAKDGMVVTAQHLATQVGVDVLKAGGNAIDAAVAVGYALAVVYPAAGNLGGGGFMTIVLADGRRIFLDFRERAPLAGTRDMYLDAQGQVKADASTQGWLAVATPGSVAGLEEARERYGTRSRAALISPAIGLAREGFVLDEGDAAMLRYGAHELARDAAASSIFLVQGHASEAGATLRQPDLALTLQRISELGRAGFYRGPVAEAMLAGSHAGGGILAQADFDQYAVRERAPLECDYRGYHVVSAPPPSSGGTALCEMLGVLEGYPLRELGFHSAKALHVEIETMRHVYVDRNNFLGDPDFVRNPVEHLIDRSYAAKLRAAIPPDHASRSSDLAAGAPPHEGSNTTHYCVADRFGNVVAVTYTLNEWFGASVVAPGTGVLMNDEMDDFTVKRGVPNMYGLVQGAANAIEPGKRPLSSMTPTILLRDGKPVLAIGTPGGSRIITAVLQAILNLVDYGMDVQEALDAPRIHQQWMPEATFIEPYAVNADTRRILEAMGHRFVETRPANHLEAILVGAPSLGGKPEGSNRFYGANDPRHRTGLALGF